MPVKLCSALPLWCVSTWAASFCPCRYELARGVGLPGGTLWGKNEGGGAYPLVWLHHGSHLTNDFYRVNS